MEHFKQELIIELAREMQVADRYQVLWSYASKLKHKKPRTFQQSQKLKLLKRKLLILGGKH